MTIARARVRRRSLSLAGRLTLLSLLALVMSLSLGGYASLTLKHLHESQETDWRLDGLSETTLKMDELHETLKA